MPYIQIRRKERVELEKKFPAGVLYIVVPGYVGLVQYYKHAAAQFRMLCHRHRRQCVVLRMNNAGVDSDE